MTKGLEFMQKTESRRKFIKRIWGGLGIIAFGELILVCAAFLKPGKPRAADTDSVDLVVAGDVDTFDINSVTAFKRGRFYLSRLENGEFVALSRKCTHLGCTVPWVKEEGKFICPCHASSFDIAGNVINAPATRALDRYPVIIENNIVLVDTGRSFEHRTSNTEH
jgi:Rieske Fe-S protein